MTKWLGACFVLLACGGCGFSMAAAYQKKERDMRQILHMILFMESELECRLTPLPELCRKASHQCRGSIRRVMEHMAKELDAQHFPDACSCMTAAMRTAGNVDSSLRPLFLQLGHCLGRFDLPGQIRGLQAVQKECKRELRRAESNGDIRLKNYQTLGLCAGAALAILFV